MASEGKNLIGVDIGSTSIKVCEIKESRGNRKLIRFGYHPLPAETIVDGHIINSGAVVEGLELLFHKAKRRNVALRASGHSVIIKKITMPLMTSAELFEQIHWEAEQHIPFDLAEVTIDYEVLHRRDGEGQMDVLLVAAKKEEISDLTNLAVSLNAMGVHIFDNCDLEELGMTAARLKRWHFLVTAAPIPVEGGTGSPLNPIATY